MRFAVNILLWLVVGILAVIAATRGRVLLDDGVRAGVMEFILLLPRIGVGVVGSGFVAEPLPNEWIAPWIGPESGLLGVAIATIGGALTPRGPVVGFSIGAGARSARRLLSRRGRAQERSRCAAGDRLFDRLGSLCNPPPGDLGSADDAGARGMAARVGVTAAAVLGSRARYSARTALTSPKVAFSAGIPLL